MTPTDQPQGYTISINNMDFHLPSHNCLSRLDISPTHILTPTYRGSHLQ